MTWAQTVAMKLASAANARRGVGGFARSTRAATHRTLGCTLVLANPGAPPLPVVVRLVRIGPGHLDDDNLAYAFKSIRDGVARAYGRPDHDPGFTWTYAQERARTYAVRVELAPRGDAP